MIFYDVLMIETISDIDLGWKYHQHILRVSCNSCWASLQGVTHGLPKVIECPVFLLSGIEWGCYRHPGCSKWVTPSLPRCRPVLKIFGTVCISNCAKDVCLVKELLGLHCYVKEKVVLQPPFDRIYASWREGNDDFYMSEA